MKTLNLILFAMLFPLFSPAQRPDNKEEKALKLEKEFLATKSLVETNRFQFELDQVYPQSGHDLSRFSPRGSFTITDTLAKGHLPFFGRAYSLPYGEGGGIEFDGVMKERNIKIENKKRKKNIVYRFSISGDNDTYQIIMNIGPGGSCSVNLNSNNRAPISYSGRISPLKEN